MGEIVQFLQDARADYKIGALLEWWSHSLTASDPLQNRADLWIRYENLHVCTWKLINKQCTNISINMGEIVQFLQDARADYKIGALLEWWSHSLTAFRPPSKARLICK